MAARRGLHGAIVDDLGRRIVHGSIPAGSPLAAEELGTEYDVSRTVVRETIRVLETKGLIRARQNVGTRVLEPAAWNDLDEDVLTWRLTGPDSARARRELQQLRWAIEPTVARLAALQRGAADEDALRAAARDMSTASDAADVGAFTHADARFHAALFRAADNSLLRALLSIVGTALNDRASTIAQHGLSADAVRLHGDLARAVSAGDPEAAAEAMSDLLAEGENPA